MPSPFRVTGIRFDRLPAGVIGIRSTANDDPLMQRDLTDDNHTYDIEVVDENTMNVVLRGDTAPAGASYFSAILSEDRSIVYWTNDTNPLPRSLEQRRKEER